MMYIIFCFYEIKSIRKIIIKNYPTMQKIYEETVNEIKRLQKINSTTTSSFKRLPKTVNKKTNNKKSKNKINKSRNKKVKDDKIIISEYNENKEEYNDNKTIEKSEKNDNDKERDINELPFSLAIQKDNRNSPQIFISLLIQKLELVDLIFGGHKIRIILIFEYILSSLLDFLINTLLYSDDIVSQKYHNNAKLDYIVTLLLSITSK